MSGGRLRVRTLGREASPAAFAEAVREGLCARPKRLPCRFFYDREGSLLFEQICRLPEYYLPQAETEILQARAAEVAARFDGPVALVELGSGSAVKTRILIDAILARGGRLRYVPIDISPEILEQSARSLLATYESLEVHAVVAEYREGLEALAQERDRPRLVLWLGSNVGNLDRGEAAAFLAEVRATLGTSDRFLLGVDLRKDRRVLEAAYDDAAGVTARFNKNLLARIDRELGGHFDLDAFAHRAVYDELRGRIDLYLVSRFAQEVPIEALGIEVPFEAGEAIHTESSYKYSPDEIETLARDGGFALEARWMDARARFCTVLMRPAASHAPSVW